MSLLTLDQVECASILWLVSEQLSDIFVTDFLVVLLLLLLFLLLVIVAYVLDYLLNPLRVNLCSHGLVRVHDAHGLPLGITHKYTTKVVVPHIEERLAHTLR